MKSYQDRLQVVSIEPGSVKPCKLIVRVSKFECLGRLVRERKYQKNINNYTKLDATIYEKSMQNACPKKWCQNDGRLFENEAEGGTKMVEILNKNACREIRKIRETKKHKWYLGLPIHIQLICIILNLLFIGILINWYILLVFIYSLFPISLLPIVYHRALWGKVHR